MYNNFLIFIKTKTPSLYKILKKIKNRIFFNKKYIKNLSLETNRLLESYEKQSYYEFKKKEFFQTKDKKTSSGIIEINNSCNINCVMCDTKSSTRQKKLMNVELFEKSTSEMKKQGIKTVLLHTIGDPLANAKLKDYLKVLRKYKMQAGISSNGLMLDKHLETLKEYFDVCSSIRFSIDGVKKETYEKIRFGGIFEKLISNLNLAEKELKKIGYEFAIELVITKDNFDELGEFIVFFRKYVNNPYKNMYFNFMNSLSPNNDYFLKNNTLTEHTEKNYFCYYASSLIPYVLVDGRVSACCRDYDGSLVIDDLNKNSLEKSYSSPGFKNLQNAHIKGDKIDDYHLCKSCYTVDSRVAQIWKNTISSFLFKYPNESANFYQGMFKETLNTLKTLNKNSYSKLINKYSLQ